MSSCADSALKAYSNEKPIRGYIAFTEGDPFPIVLMRHGRTVDHVVLDGVRFERSKIGG